MMNVCGSKTRGGEPCKIAGMKNGRCRMHGGKTPKTNQNAVTHGIYAQTLTDAERGQWGSIDLAEIDDELRLCRIRLVRALNAENAHGDKPELDEVTIKPGAEGRVEGEKRYRRRDYGGVVDKLIARIESLTKTKEGLITQRLTNEKLRRELEDPNKGLPEPKQVIIGVEDASCPDAEQAAI